MAVKKASQTMSIPRRRAKVIQVYARRTQRFTTMSVAGKDIALKA